jgi:hypothetical protein
MDERWQHNRTPGVYNMASRPVYNKPGYLEKRREYIGTPGFYPDIRREDFHPI